MPIVRNTFTRVSQCGTLVFTSKPMSFLFLAKNVLTRVGGSDIIISVSKRHERDDANHSITCPSRILIRVPVAQWIERQIADL